MRKIILPGLVLLCLFAMAFQATQKQTNFITKLKDGNYKIPAKVISPEDATALLRMTTISPRGFEVCESSISVGVATSRCWRSDNFKTTPELQTQVDKIMGKYLKQ
jgi:hypothetical protein